MGVPAALLLAVSTIVMYLYFSAGAIHALGNDNALPRWLAALERAQTPVGRGMRPVAVVVGAGASLLSQATVVAVLISLSPDEWPAVGMVLLAELVVAAAWSARIALRWRPDRR
jgi:hypothetical protein